MTVENIAGLAIGLAIACFGILMLVFIRRAFGIFKNQLRLLFGETLASIATPAMLAAGGWFAVGLGVLMVAIGCTGSFG